MLAATVVGGALPTEHGYTLAFIFAAGAYGLAAVASLAAPRPERAPSRSPPADGQTGRSQKRSSRQRARNGSMAAPSAISIIPSSAPASRPVASIRPVASLP